MTIRICIILAFCIVISCFSSGAEVAVPHFALSVTKDTASVDDTVYLLVNLKDNKGFGALQFCITYDKEKLLLKKASAGEIIPGGAITALNTDIPGEIHFSVISLQDIKENGTALVSEFAVKDKGTASFDFKLLAYADENGTSLDSTQNDAEIIIYGEDAKAEAPEYENEKKPSGSIPISQKKNEIIVTEKTEPPKESKQISFSDVAETHWAYNQIHKVAEMELFSGTGENIFSPDLPMTRAMFVTVLHRFSGNPEADKADFDDIEDSWYTDAVSWAAKNGIVSGTGDNRFSPDAYITRGQIATILCRFKKGKSIDVKSINSFNDSDSIPEWGREPIAWAIEQGLIMGRSGGNIAFNDNATRAETAVIFTRFLNIR